MRQAAALILLTVLAAAGCTSAQAPVPARPPATITSSAASPGPVPQATAAAACPAAITPRPLPTWARAGFTPPTVAMPYVMGAQGNIVAILWAEHDPLRAPPLPDRSNKILWVSRLGLQPTDSLQIRATLSGTGRTVTREVTGGPGPSIINLPTAGCWSLNLSWSGHQDHLELRYVAS